MDLGIAGRTALVLGAGGGLGGAIARSLADEGVHIAAADISADSLTAIVGDVEKRSVSATSLVWDLADLDSIDDHVSHVERTLGGVDILVNVTGGPPPTPIAGQDISVWTSHFNAMVMAVIAVTDRVLPGMRERGWGRVITSTSSGVVAPIPNLGLSNALRLSLVGWSKTLAGEVGREGITSNIVLPGRILTNRISFLDEQKAKREGRDVADVVAESTNSIPLERYGRPQEYGDTVAFLASERASYITGSVVRVDGGFIPSI